MARLNLFFGDKALNRVVAHMPAVRGEVASEANERGAVAKAKLAGHRDQGHSQIDVVHADVDSYIMLSDERGEYAAHIVEFGRKGWGGVGAIAAAARG